MAPKIRKIFALFGALVTITMVCGCVASGPALSLSRVESRDLSGEPPISPSPQSPSPAPPSPENSEPPKTEPVVSVDTFPADDFIFPAECWETAKFVDGATSIIIEMRVAAGTPVFSPYAGEASKIYWGDEDDGVYEMSVEFTSENHTSITVTATVIKTIDVLTDERESGDICPELNTQLKTIEVLASQMVGTIESDETLGFCVFGNVALELPPEEEIPAGMSPLEFVKSLFG